MPILLEPSFKYTNRDGSPHRPTFREVISEFGVIMNVVRYPTNRVTAANFLAQTLTFTSGYMFLREFVTGQTLLFFIFALFLLGTVYNTLWYHRYCAHASFKFTHNLIPTIILWTNPLSMIFREESYVVPHHIHHQQTDKPSDPYGPHRGWLGSFFAPEIYQRLNPSMTRDEFNSQLSKMRHTGISVNSYELFQSTGCVERLSLYICRVAFSQLLWIATIVTFGGYPYLAAFYSAMIVATALIRDFNWRGHGGNQQDSKISGWDFDTNSLAHNMHFYGYIAAEWHDNHHRYPFSANNGFLPNQPDMAFQLIKILSRLGIVTSFVDARPLFEKECLGFSSVKNSGRLVTDDRNVAL